MPGVSPAVAATADALGLPLIALHRVTRFVEITEAVHRVIVAEQYAAVEFARTVHETFTEPSVRRAALAEIVQTAAAMLDASVVLEDLVHRVLALPARHASASAVLENWEATSRLLPDDWNAVAVGPHPQRWGRLILRADGVPTARARSRPTLYERLRGGPSQPRGRTGRAHHGTAGRVQVMIRSSVAEAISARNPALAATRATPRTSAGSALVSTRARASRPLWCLLK